MGLGMDMSPSGPCATMVPLVSMSWCVTGSVALLVTWSLAPSHEAKTLSMWCCLSRMVSHTSRYMPAPS